MQLRPSTSKCFLVMLVPMLMGVVFLIAGCGGGDAVSQTISIDDVSVDESNSTETADLVFTVTITLDPVAGSDVTVDWATSDGTAEDENGDGDYTADSGTLTFASGEALTQQVTVVVTGDDTAEGDEILYVDLSSVGNATISDNQGAGTITDDEPGSISGTVTYTGSETGTYALAFLVGEVFGDPPAAVAAYSIDETEFPFAYTISDVPPGTYFMLAWWDVDESGGPTTGDPYNGIVSGIVVESGLDTTENVALDEVAP